MIRILLCPVLLYGLTLFSACPQSAGSSIPPAHKLLATLRQDHPRLIATTNDFARLKQRIARDPVLKQWHDRLHADALQLLRQAPSEYEIPDGLRLLHTSRRVLERVQLLALMYRLEGDRRFAERAGAELNAAAAFKDWNPRHFLDTAEMTHAFAIGYDWLYDAWSDPQRAAWRRAITEKGLRPAWQAYESNAWWTRTRINWNQVCNGGIGIGALAIGDVDPELAGQILQAALKSLPLAMADYGPDGAWPEGPGYWHYATRYNVAFLAALESALGTDFGLAEIRGFSEAGLFPIHAMGPAGLNFNYADARTDIIRAPEMFWLARRFQQPAWAAYQLARVAPRPLDLLWADTSISAASLNSLPLDKYFRNTEIATFRSAWNDPEALFVGFKAGDNAAGHSHLDLGSFVLDALGQRWAIDFGPDDYNLPQYFGAKRWTYYRLRAEGHNTLVIGPGAGPDQAADAVARITRFESQPARAFAIANLSAAYAGKATRVERGIALLDRKVVLVQDQVATAGPAQVYWQMHTPAQVRLVEDKRDDWHLRRARLTLAGRQLQAVLQSPASARFSVRPAGPLPGSQPPPRQGTNAGVSTLTIEAHGLTNLCIAVAFVPVKDGEPPAGPLPKLQPLDQW